MKPKSPATPKALQKSKTTPQGEHMFCRMEHMSEVHTIQQAFPAVDKGGHRRGGQLPRQLHCSTCNRFLLSEFGELPFFVCNKCWNEGRIFTICTACHEAAAVKQASENLVPLSPSMQRRRSSTHTIVSMGSRGSSPKRRGSAASIPVVKRSDSQLSVDTGISDEVGKQTTQPLEPLVVSKHRLSHLSSRRASTPTPQVSRAWTLRRKSDSDAEVSGLEEEALPEKLSASWNATFEEGKANTRKEWRRLNFTGRGQIFGNGKECVLQGHAEMLNLQWMEEHPWGTLHVTAKLNLKYMKIIGTFQASDGGKGKITLSQDATEDLD
ncbi:unnamed protein product [Effrenium voratum]|nr:unnamed protein product [Effrenium voratum]